MSFNHPHFLASLIDYSMAFQVHTCSTRGIADSATNGSVDKKIIPLIRAHPNYYHNNRL